MRGRECLGKGSLGNINKKIQPIIQGQKRNQNPSHPAIWDNALSPIFLLLNPISQVPNSNTYMVQTRGANAVSQFGTEETGYTTGSIVYLNYICKVKVKVKSLSRVQLFVTPWTVAHQAP